MSEIYFDSGAGDDMGIFAGYGAGFYFKIGAIEHGPFMHEAEAEEALRKLEIEQVSSHVG